MMNSYKNKGFTLVELLLVLLIVSIVAGVSLTSLTQKDDQERYIQSLRGLYMLSDALVKVSDYENQQTISGFVSDNGKLPDVVTGNDVLQIQPLIELDSSWGSYSLYGAYTPIYATTAGTGFASSLTNSVLFKGYRGPYIPSNKLDSQRQFRDRWGLQYEVTKASTNEISFTFNHQLADGATNKISSLTSSVTNDHMPEFWSVSLGMLSFRIDNASSTTLAAGMDGSSSTMKVGLILFVNGATPSWLTYSFAISELLSGAQATYGYGALNVNAWQVSDNNLIGSVLADVNAIRIPVGTHLVVLMDESSQTIKAQANILVLPGSSIPTLTLKVVS